MSSFRILDSVANGNPLSTISSKSYIVRQREDFNKFKLSNKHLSYKTESILRRKVSLGRQRAEFNLVFVYIALRKFDPNDPKTQETGNSHLTFELAVLGREDR